MCVADCAGSGAVATLGCCPRELGRSECRQSGKDELAEGVYAAIHKDGGGAIGNAGIVDLGDADLARECPQESSAIAREIADRTQEVFCLGHAG